MDGVHRHTPLFNSLIQFYELRELIIFGGLFTWSNNQENPIMEKLDRILVTKEWEDIFPQDKVCRLRREISDHNPLIISTGDNAGLPFIQFKFDLNWLNNPDLFSLVRQLWNKPCRAKSALDKIQQKLKLFKQYFKGRGFNLQGEWRKQRKAWQNELAEIELIEENGGLNCEQLERKTWLLCENLKSLEQEEVYWYERSHANWLLKGDNNTSFFFKCANGRKRKNTIVLLENEGQLIEGEENLLQHATNYYYDLFGPPVEYEVQIDPRVWENISKVSVLDNKWLCRPFSEEEIKIALFQMEKKNQSCWT